MSFLRNLQVKVLLAAFIPGAVILGIVALITIQQYVHTVLEVVGQRDAELARLTAARVRDGLVRQAGVLTEIAEIGDVTSTGAGAVGTDEFDLEQFDGGVTVYDRGGSPVGSSVSRSADRLPPFPLDDVFEATRASLLPTISPVFTDPVSGEESIMICVPVVGTAGEFRGVVAGVAALQGRLVNTVLSNYLDVTPGGDGLAYLVDGSGRSIFHGSPELVGADLTQYSPVAEVTIGLSGTDLSVSPTGEWVVTGFAPVPGTRWGVVTQQRWSDVEGPILNSSWTVLGLLLLGAAVAGAGIWFYIGRALRPVRQLSAGAQRIASGDFDHEIPEDAGGEVEVMAERFNAMARALKQSYSELEDRIGQRTRELADSVEENAAVAEIGRIVGSSLDISQVYDRFAEQTKRLIDSDAIAVLNVYPARRTFSVEYMSGVSIPGHEPGFEYPLEATATESAFQRGKSALIQPDSLEALGREFPGLSMAWERGIRSFLASPLVFSNEVIGLLWFSSRSTAAFDERDVEAAETVAAQIAGAVATSRLYDEINQLYGRERLRSEQLRTIGEVGRQVTSILDLDELLENVGDLVSKSFGYESTSIGIVEGDDLVFSPATNPRLTGPLRMPLTNGQISVVGSVVTSGQPAMVADVGQEPAFSAAHGEEAEGSSVTVPILARGATIGVLHSHSSRKDAFDESDQVVLQALAQEIGVAIENARLYRQQEERAEYYRILGELSSEMSSYLDLEELLSNTVGMIQDTFGYYHVGIGLVEGNEVVYKYGAGAPADYAESQSNHARLHFGTDGLAGEVAATGEPILVSDVSKDPRHPGMCHASTRSELSIPIRAKGEVIGVLDLQSERIGAFDEADLVMIQSLANEVGIAIEDARIFEAERRQNEQMAAMNAVALNVSAVLTLDELLPHVVQLVRETFDFHAVGVFLVDEESDELVLQAVAAVADNVPPRGTRVKIGSEGIVGHVAETGLPWATGDTTNDPFYTDLGYENIPTRSELGMPIKEGDLVVGVLDLHSNNPDAFDDIDVLIAQTLANQLAVAIENARIFDETRDLAVLEERNRMAREIHDTLAQGFTGIVIQLEAGEQAIEDDSDELLEHVTIAKNLARQCLAEARRSVWNLLPEVLEDNPLDEVIATEVDRFNSTGSGEGSFTLIGARRQLPALTQAALLRICQESLTNTRKYADASEVSVTLDFGLEAVSLTVRDNGVGFDPESVRIAEGRGGFGLTGMRQRARLLRGDVEIDSTPGEGTKVQAWIPTG